MPIPVIYSHTYTIQRDGVTVASGLHTEFEVAAWFHSHTSFSMSWNLEHNGYTYTRAETASNESEAI